MAFPWQFIRDPVPIVQRVGGWGCWAGTMVFVTAAFAVPAVAGDVVRGAVDLQLRAAVAELAMTKRRRRAPGHEHHGGQKHQETHAQAL